MTRMMMMMCKTDDVENDHKSAQNLKDQSDYSLHLLSRAPPISAESEEGNLQDKKHLLMLPPT
jgi:hypothetical protein